MSFTGARGGGPAGGATARRSGSAWAAADSLVA
jgi:hypothetical protein